MAQVAGWFAPVKAIDAAEPTDDAALSPDGTLLVYGSDKEPGDRDLYYVTRTTTSTDVWSAPVLVPNVNLPMVDESSPVLGILTGTSLELFFGRSTGGPTIVYRSLCGVTSRL